MKLGCYWRWLQTLENESRLIKSAASLRAGSRLVPYAFDKNNRRDDSGGPQSIILEFSHLQGFSDAKTITTSCQKTIVPVKVSLACTKQNGAMRENKSIWKGGKKWNDIVPVYSFFLFIYFRMWISTKEGSLYACFYAHINNVQGLSSTWLWSYSTHYNYIRARESFKDEDRVTSSSGTAFV